MAFEDSFLDVMVDTVIWEKKTGTDEYGNAVYNPPVRIQCRYVPKAQRVLAPNGDEVVSKADLWTAGDFDIQGDDLITQPNGESDPVLRVTRPSDRDGKHHVKVTI